MSLKIGKTAIFIQYSIIILYIHGNCRFPTKTKTMTQNVRGQNKLTKEVKNILFNTLKGDYEKLNKLMYCCTHEERAKILKGFAKYLCTGSDEISKKTREILWSQLEEHYKKLRFFIPHLSAKDKVTILRGFLSDIAPEHRKEAANIISDQISKKPNPYNRQMKK